MSLRALYIIFIITILPLLFASCEHTDLDEILSSGSADGDGSGTSGGYTITFRLTDNTSNDFDGSSDYGSATSRALVTAAKLGNRLNMAVYKDGTRVTTKNQQNTDDDFGTLSVSLSEGTYDFLFLVHSCDGNATTTDPEAIKFPNNKVTDTFAYYSDDVNVTGDMSRDITVSRRVAMYRFIVTEAIPDEVTTMQFYYTGGSSTLNPVTGFGCVNSRQTETRTVTSHDAGQVFEVYTFPHDTTDELKMKVTAFDSSGNTIHEVEYEEIPVELNMITIHSAPFFTDETGDTGVGTGPQFIIKGYDDWSGEIVY
ncbi:MAG: hypothetical protein LUC22_04950 [Prevotella sp.]|nr:hypothetical protein [Prevotella sp.]